MTEIIITTERASQVDRSTKIKPKIVAQLCDWQYLERSIHRLLCAWGRYHQEWDDKSALHRHVWEQAECVRRLRERISEFPGGKPDAAVSNKLEALGNAVLLAPTFEDALDGIYCVLTKALVECYTRYVQSAHPIHDAPTVRMLHEINTAKEQQWLWWREYRRRSPNKTDAAYLDSISAALDACGNLSEALPVDESAVPVGLATEFRLPRFSNRRREWLNKPNITAYYDADFSTNVEARRLFWAYGYMMEKNLPDDQLRWIYWGHFMPWEFLHDVSRHLWDESRHGDSGLSRLRDFGIELEEIGFPPYYDFADLKGVTPGTFDLDPAEPLSPNGLYEEVFFIGMVAESGHFEVKNEAFADFRDGEDMESAEMMLFDIIDETSHVQYAHRWLPVLAAQVGVDPANYKTRSVRERKEKQAAAIARREQDRTKARDENAPEFVFYQSLLARAREKTPLRNVDSEVSRHPLPF